MGEMADFTNGGAYYPVGKLPPALRKPRQKQCKHCGAKKLHWGTNDNGKYWLYDTEGKPHKCK